jgi:nitric-oxide synthase
LNDGFTLLSQKELGVLLIPPSGREKAENWRGLDSEHKLQIKFEDAERYNS